MKIYLKYFYLFIALSITLLIVWLSSVPDLCVGQPGTMLDEILTNFAHVPLYALFAGAWGKFVIENGWVYKNPRMRLYMVLALVVFSVTDELHQSFVPGRSASVLDLGLDSIGIILGMTIVKFWQIKENENREFHVP